jgi:SAM-dependent methyltransferase
MVRQWADRSRACLIALPWFTYNDLQTGALRTPSSYRHIFSAVTCVGSSLWPGVARPTWTHSSTDRHARSVGTAARILSWNSSMAAKSCHARSHAVGVEAGEEVRALVACCGGSVQAIPRLSTKATAKSFITGTPAYAALRAAAIVATMETVNAQIEEALRTPMEGWNFSWLEGRASESRPPWNYRELVAAAAAEAASVLDIDTGGGEFLASIVPLSASVFATEGHAPNVTVARKRLSPLGVSVAHAASARDNVDQTEASPEEDRSSLPFASGAFDLVMDRHSSYWPSEVHRILVPGGRFLTQQRGEAGVVGASWSELFGRPAHPHERFTRRFAVNQLEEAGFEILRSEEADTPMTFRDLAGVVYYLRLVPWAVERFDVEGDRGVLLRVAAEIEARGAITVRGSHMLLEARKP